MQGGISVRKVVAMFAWISDTIWAYVIPAIIVLNVFQVSLEYVVGAIVGLLVLGIVATVVYILLFTVHAVSDTIRYRSSKGQP